MRVNLKLFTFILQIQLLFKLIFIQCFEAHGHDFSTLPQWRPVPDYHGCIISIRKMVGSSSRRAATRTSSGQRRSALLLQSPEILLKIARYQFKLESTLTVKSKAKIAYTVKSSFLAAVDYHPQTASI